jgi:hypothetical protein
MTKLEPHPLANRFPLIEGAEFDLLVTRRYDRMLYG